ncbi:F420-dependent methylene-tetrahydromethanopterin reductase [Sphingomonas sp. LH128]|nr:F420-dependent methylene-tetrahydromethanopterin reductase [Sphingomonas sp. LH128]
MSGLRFGVYCEMQTAPEKSEQELLWDVFHQIEHADQMGYYSYNLIEHHCFASFGTSANPLAMFAAAAQRTTDIRFRTLCHTLPLHNPMVLAGEIAQTDILTGGRLELGFGRGHGWLYPPLGIAMEESQGRYQEGLDLLELAWTKDRFSYHGEYFDVDNVSVVPKPVQKPYPKAYMTGTSGKNFELAAEKGWGIVCGGPAPYDVFAPGIATYRAACQKSGAVPDIGYNRAIFLAEDENTAMREGREAILNFFEFNIRPHDSLRGNAPLRDRLNASGYQFYASDVLQSLRNFSFEQIVENELAWVGTPAQITKKLAAFHDKVKFNEFNIIAHYGNIEPWKAVRNQELFAREVMPAFA